MEVLQMSREFNPVISFDVTSPDSSVRTSQNQHKDNSLGNREVEPKELEFQQPLAGNLHMTQGMT